MSIDLNPITQLGDVWQLGQHRLWCGDSTSLDEVRRFVTEPVDLVFTDPPYNVNYRSKRQRAIKNDCLTPIEYQQLLTQALNACKAIMKKTASFYLCHASISQHLVQAAIENVGFIIRNQIVLAKTHFVLNWSRYKPQHELVFYGFLKRQRDAWYGDKKQTTLWSFPKPAHNNLHPTMKPLCIIEKALTNSTKVNDVVFDGFAGSGSTLMACEQLQRRAYVIEIEPQYCDVIIQRFQQFTGQQAYLVQSGMSFDELAERQRLLS